MTHNKQRSSRSVLISRLFLECIATVAPMVCLSQLNPSYILARGYTPFERDLIMLMLSIILILISLFFSMRVLNNIGEITSLSSNKDIKSIVKSPISEIQIIDQISHDFELWCDHYEMNNYTEAIELYTSVIRLDLYHIKAYIKRGECFLEIEEYERSINDLTKVIDLDSKNSEAYFSRGISLLRLNEIEDAIEDFSEVIHLNSTDAEAHAYRASLNAKLGNHQNSINDYNIAINLSPAKAIFFRKRGETYFQLRNQEMALKDYRRAAEMYHIQEDKHSYDNLIRMIEELEDNIER